MTYEFTLIFTLPARDAEPSAFADALFEAGCDDAILAAGARGLLALDFTRSAASAQDAVRSAIDSVRNAIPEAELIEVKPDFVNLSDVAELIGCSRQNLRKYASGEIKTVARRFPAPVVVGSPSLWHLNDVTTWLRDNTSLRPAETLVEVSQVAYEINLGICERRKRTHHSYEEPQPRSESSTLVPATESQADAPGVTTPQSSFCPSFRAIASRTATERELQFRPGFCDLGRAA